MISSSLKLKVGRMGSLTVEASYSRTAEAMTPATSGQATAMVMHSLGELSVVRMVNVMGLARFSSDL